MQMKKPNSHEFLMGWSICQQLELIKENTQNIIQMTKLPVRTEIIKAGKLLLWTLAYNSSTSSNS